MNEIEVVSNLDVAGRPAQVLNATSIETGAIASDPAFRQIASAMGEWVTTARSRGVGPSMFQRNRYLPPENPYEQMKVAKYALANDDIVSGVAEITEAIAFNGLKWESEDADAADVFNQMSADLNLDAVVRSMWREEFATEQAVVAKLWGPATYQVRGVTPKGNKRKKSYDVFVPKRLVVLDSLKTVPIGYGPLREDRMAWNSTPDEVDSYVDAIVGARIDPLMTQFFTGQYKPGADEVRQLAALRVNPDFLLEMNPEQVFRHCSTKADYELFATPRMRSVFALLDLKQQLMQSDRASLIGAANYILLIRKGNDAKPGTSEEIANLREQYNFLAKLPVIISDHRLDIEIIAPKLDFVLKPEAYEVLDSRILSRLMGSLAVTGGASKNNSAGSQMLGVLIAKGMENRRHMLKRTLEREIAKAVVNHPKNVGLFDVAPSLVYTPRNIALDSDQAMMSAMLTLRTQREISRETILEYLGLDQATEAQRLEVEADLYDDTFKTQIPFAAAAPDGSGDPAPADTQDQGNNGGATTPNNTPEAPASSGRRGGRPTGGGTSPQSPAAQTKPKSANGNPSTK